MASTLARSRPFLLVVAVMEPPPDADDDDFALTPENLVEKGWDMRIAFALFLVAMLTPGLGPARMSKSAAPSCGGRSVWVVSTTARSKFYVLPGSSRFGKKPGRLLCEQSAKLKGYHISALPAAAHSQPETNHANLAGSPVPTATASPVPTGPVTGENPSLSRLARAQIDIFRTGKIDHTQYGPELNALFTDPTLAQWSQILAISGSVESFSYLGSTLVSGLPVSQYSVTFEHVIAVPGQAPTKQWIESIAADQLGRVVYLSFVPKH